MPRQKQPVPQRIPPGDATELKLHDLHVIGPNLQGECTIARLEEINEQEGLLKQLESPASTPRQSRNYDKDRNENADTSKTPRRNQTGNTIEQPSHHQAFERNANKCCVCGRKSPAHTLFPFPTEIHHTAIFQEWVRVANIEGVPTDVIEKYARLCECHFVDTDFIVCGNVRRLQETSIPTLELQRLPDNHCIVTPAHTPKSKRKEKNGLTPTPNRRSPRILRRTQNAVLQKGADQFNRENNGTACIPCSICNIKKCHPLQVMNTGVTKADLPDELLRLLYFPLCCTCKQYLLSNTKTRSANAYWNALNHGPIPDEIRDLTDIERRLLSRIIPSVKIMKLSDLYEQNSFKGQAVLVARDIFAATEKFPKMLQRPYQDTSIVVVTENLENLNKTRKFTVSRDRLYIALQWLIKNNPLYKDVTIDEAVEIDANDFIRVLKQNEDDRHQMGEHQPLCRGFVSIGEQSRILHSSWNQDDKSIFNHASAGKQCCAMVLSNIVRAAICPPSQWSTEILDGNMTQGDKLYVELRTLRDNDKAHHKIPESGYLRLSDFDIIRNHVNLFDQLFSIHYNEEPEIYGSLEDNQNIENIGFTLSEGLQRLFNSHDAGILITQGFSFGVLRYTGKYYFTDSHSCDEKGARETNGNGKACVVECDTLPELLRITRRATGSPSEQYNIDFVDVHNLDAGQRLGQQCPEPSQVAIEPPRECDMSGGNERTRDE